MLIVLCSEVHKNGAMAMVGIGNSIRLGWQRYQTQIGIGTGIRTTPVLYYTVPDRHRRRHRYQTYGRKVFLRNFTKTIDKSELLCYYIYVTKAKGKGKRYVKGN